MNNQSEKKTPVRSNAFWARVETALGPTRTGRLGLYAVISLVASFVVMVVAQLMWDDSRTGAKFVLVILGIVVTIPLIRSMLIFVMAAKRSQQN